MTPGFSLRELSPREDPSRRGSMSFDLSRSVTAGGGSSHRRAASVLTTAPSQPAAASTRKRRRKVPSCPATVFLTGALVCLATATASAMPGSSGTCRGASAAAGGGGGRNLSWTTSSHKNDGSQVDGDYGASTFGADGSGFVHALGARTRHRQEQPDGKLTSQPRLLLRGAGFRGSRGREVDAAEALRVRGGGRPWFTGYEDTTEGEGFSSEEGWVRRGGLSCPCCLVLFNAGR